MLRPKRRLMLMMMLVTIVMSMLMMGSLLLRSTPSHKGQGRKGVQYAIYDIFVDLCK